MLSGGCLCGQVRYEASAAPFHETICHCRSCRLAVGAPSVAWFSVERAAFRFVGAEPASFRSSPKVVRRFCPNCGTSLTYESEAFPEEIDVTTATLDDPALAPPKDHTQVAAKLPWILLCDGLPAYGGRRAGREPGENG